MTDDGKACSIRDCAKHPANVRSCYPRPQPVPDETSPTRNDLRMRRTRYALAIMIGVVCALGTAAVGSMRMKLAEHPLSTGDPWMWWFLWVGPYALLLASAAFSLRSSGALVFLAILSALMAPVLTLACYQETEEAFFFLNARAAGRHPMNCGPPVFYLHLVIAYAVSFATLVVASVGKHEPRI